MNILFVLKVLEIGGLEIVSSVLANRFSAQGNRVVVFAFKRGEGKTIDGLDDSVRLVVGNGYSGSKDNVALLRSILVEEKIDVVVNQWGLPLVPVKVINKARKGLDIKVISVFHNDPMQNGRLQGVKIAMESSRNPLRKAILAVQWVLFRMITGYAMGYVYRHSDLFEVLSPGFVPHFKRFTGIRNPRRLVVQTNPVTLSNAGFEYDASRKAKEVVYVGRIDNVQKRVFRIIDTWSLIEKNHPDWRLTIVGDGDERGNMEQMVKDKGLSHVFFEGFQPPRDYYARASALILTSEYEGFPLVITECMSFGVVPVVYGSYPAVYDIIEDGKDGMILPKTDAGFDARAMAGKLEQLMQDSERLETMARAAIVKSSDWSVDRIYEQWMGVINGLAWKK